MEEPGPNNSRFPGMKRVLVIQGGKLGDMVCTTPVFRAIKKTRPESFLIVAGNKINQEVLAGNPYIDKYVYLDAVDKRLIHHLNIDTVLLLTPNPSILWRLLNARVSKIIVPKVVGGFSPYSTKKYQFLSYFATRVPHDIHKYAPQEYLSMLKPLGIYSTDTTKELFVTEEAVDIANGILSKAGDKIKVAIAPGAGNKVKEWPPEKFNEVARYFSTKGAAIILIGGLSDKHLGEIVKHNVDCVVDTIGELSIEVLKAVVRQVDVFVSADTGPIYIAEAFGIPTVDIVGPVDPRVQPPKGTGHAIVMPPNNNLPQLFIMNSRVYDLQIAEEMARSTTVESVIQAAEEVLSSKRSKTLKG